MRPDQQHQSPGPLRAIDQVCSIDKPSGKHRAVGKPSGKRSLAGLGISLLTAISLSGCTWKEVSQLGMPEPATEEAPIILRAWQGNWIAAFAVGILVWGLIIWSVVVYRRRKGDRMPRQTNNHLPIETLWTVAPLIVVMGIFFFAARDEAQLTAVKGDQAMTVNVVGFRWAWTFNYVDQNVYDSGAPAYTSTAEDRGGVPAASDDPGLSTLYLPINKKVKFELTSPDVIHSFWVPVFLFKLDVVPGRTNAFEVTPNQLGTFSGKCAELCGVDHSRMLFQVKIVTQAEFDSHVERLKQRGQVGQLTDGRTTNKAQKV